MKKHFKAYINGFSGAKELRALLMEAENAAESVSIASSYLRQNNPQKDLTEVQRQRRQEAGQGRTAEVDGV